MITFSFICSVGKRSISKTDSCVDRPILALSSAYQEFLMALNWWRQNWYKEHEQLYTYICVVSTLGVKKNVWKKFEKSSPLKNLWKFKVSLPHPPHFLVIQAPTLTTSLSVRVIFLLLTCFSAYHSKCSKEKRITVTDLFTFKSHWRHLTIFPS